MERRTFLKSIGAAASMTALPLQGLSAAAATPVRYGMSPYALAKYTARINKQLTPEMLKTLLGFSDTDAKSMMRRLMAENILTAPDATGISRTSTEYLANFKARRDKMKELITRLNEAVDELEEPHTKDTPDDEYQSSTARDTS